MTSGFAALIVDDSEDDQSLYRRALRALGCRIVPAMTAKEGLDRIADVQPDVILLDFNLPDMDGVEFLERFAVQGCAAVPIIMLTGQGNEAVAVQAMKLGASDYLVKETDGGHLRLLPSVIRRALAAHDERMRNRRLVALHEAILGMAAEGIVGIDAEGKIIFANPAAERILLSTAGQLIGRPFAEFVLAEDGHGEWSTHSLARVHDGSVTVSRDCDSFVRCGGTHFPVAYNASPLDFEGHGRFGWVLVFHDISERKQAEGELIRIAKYDALTGLPNRLMFQDYLTRYIARAARTGKRLALMFMDLDGFKKINDELGHLAGDQVLQFVAQRLVKCVRGGDLVSRFGGDEFTVILEECELDQLALLGARIGQELEAPFELDKQSVQISVSIGVSFYPNCGTDAHALIQKADAAMYVVKKGGKNGFGLCSELLPSDLE
jgi:diguanylate cyclase (GGDEF)-like protein/PAS domain S-box-containing protein